MNPEDEFNKFLRSLLGMGIIDEIVLCSNTDDNKKDAKTTNEKIIHVDFSKRQIKK